MLGELKRQTFILSGFWRPEGPGEAVAGAGAFRGLPPRRTGAVFAPRLCGVLSLCLCVPIASSNENTRRTELEPAVTTPLDRSIISVTQSPNTVTFGGAGR